jgi:hypothetical protein
MVALMKQVYGAAAFNKYNGNIQWEVVAGWCSYPKTLQEDHPYNNTYLATLKISVANFYRRYTCMCCRIHMLSIIQFACVKQVIS